MNDIEAVADITKFMALWYPQVDVASTWTMEALRCVLRLFAGFTSVMIDCSMLPFEENVATAEVTKWPTPLSVRVAELGGGQCAEMAEDRLSLLLIRSKPWSLSSVRL